MKGTAAVILGLTVVACASNPKPQQEPSTVPPPQPVSEMSVETRLNELQTSMTELLDRLDVLNARIAKLESAATAAPDPVPAPAPAPQRAESTSVIEMYRQALILYGQGKQKEARAVFQQVFDADPGSSLADNALFWIGETYYSAGDYSNAMRYYDRVIREYAEQNKAPDAMLKLGMAYEKTGDVAMARRTFEQCIQKFPYSAPASAAKAELKRIRY